MAEQPTIKKKRFDGTEVEILGETYEEGCCGREDKYQWIQRLSDDRRELLRFLETGLRYWYSDEWYGSEKRKTPA